MVKINFDSDIATQVTNNINEGNTKLLFIKYSENNKSSSCNEINRIFDILEKSDSYRQNAIKKWKTFMNNYANSIKTVDNKAEKTFKNR